MSSSNKKTVPWESKKIMFKGNPLDFDYVAVPSYKQTLSGEWAYAPQGYAVQGPTISLEEDVELTEME